MIVLQGALSFHPNLLVLRISWKVWYMKLVMCSVCGMCIMEYLKWIAMTLA